MMTKSELEANIIKLTSKINSEFPELSKYIQEIAVIESDDEGVNLKNLEDYYESLKGILNKYSKSH